MTNQEWTDGSNKDNVEDEVVAEVSITIPQSQKGVTAFRPADKRFLTTVFSDEEENAITSRIGRGYFADIPIICYKSPKYKKEEDDEINYGCPYYQVCPLRNYPEDMTPFCAVERWFIINLVQAYAEDLGITDTAAIDISEIKDLVRIDIQLARLDKQSQIDSSDFVQQITSYDQEGNAATRFEEHPKHQLRERLLNRKQRILKDLMGTRESMRSFLSLTQYRKSAAITAQEKFQRKTAELEKQNKGMIDDTK